MKALKKLIACTLACVLSLATFVMPANAQVVNETQIAVAETETAVQPRAAGQHLVTGTATTSGWLTNSVSFTGSTLAVTASATLTNGNPSTVTVTIKYQASNGLYYSLKTATLPVNGQSVTIFPSLDIDAGTNYQFYLKCNGSSGSTANVVIAAVSY